MTIHTLCAVAVSRLISPLPKLVFRLRLRAFQKCTAGVAASNEIARWEEKEYFTPVHTSHQSQSDCHNVSSSHNCSFLLNFPLSKAVIFQPNLAKPVDKSATMYARGAMSIFPLRWLLFFCLTSYPPEIVHFGSPNESFPVVSGLWTCVEIAMSIPLGAHA